jgi:hypothetical protein
MTDFSHAIAGMFERNVDAAVSSLQEPATTEVARARRISALLVETLGGYAFGTVAGQLVRATATWFGATEAGLLRAAISATTTSPKRGVVDEASVDAVLAHVPIVLTRELVTALRARLGTAALDVKRLVAATEAILPADRSRTSGAMFSELKRDSVFEDRLSLEITTGWIYARAAIERNPVRAPDISPRARDLWQMWSRLAGRPTPVPTRDPARIGGYISRVG